MNNRHQPCLAKIKLINKIKKLKKLKVRNKIFEDKKSQNAKIGK